MISPPILETHHRVGSKGCAHSDVELRDYILRGIMPNQDCPRIAEDFSKRTHPTVTIVFGCERDLEVRPSERVFHDMRVIEAYQLFVTAHGLEDTQATRSAVVYKIGEA